jgi:DNA-binding transcriptional regulator YhcF (GntR family)
MKRTGADRKPAWFVPQPITCLDLSTPVCKVIRTSDRFSSVHKYLMIAEHVESGIRDGTYQVGDVIPKTRDLQDMFGVSWVTVMNAMEELEGRKLIERRQGSRSVVIEPPGDVWDLVVADVIKEFVSCGWQTVTLTYYAGKWYFRAQRWRYEITLQAGPDETSGRLRKEGKTGIAFLDARSLIRVASMSVQRINGTFKSYRVEVDDE